MATNDLNLTKLPSEDLDGLAQKIENYYKSDATVKSQLSWSWQRNHSFLDGRQWIVFDGHRETGGVWKNILVSKENEYIPRPVTNYLFDNYQTLKSYLVKNKPRSEVMPNTQRHRDRQAAKIGTLCLESNWERLREQANYEYAASCVITYGTVFKKDYWDTSSLMMARVPRMEQAPKTDPNTGAVIGMEERQAVNPETGELLYDELPLGDVNTAVVEPYRLAIDPLATDIHTARWVMEYSIQPIDWVKEMYLKEEEGYTGLAADIVEEKALSGSMRQFFDLKNSSGVKNFGMAGAATMSGSDMEGVVVVKEYYERPTMQHPKGRLVVVASGKTLYAGTSPCEGPELGDWHPYSEARWEIVPGRFWGKGPMDDAVELQKQINSIDSVVTLTRKTMAIPQRLIPHGTGINPGTWTGRPGQDVFYRDLGNGAKPEIVPPVGVDQQVFQEREIKVEGMKQIMGAIDILKGDAPPNVEAASALNLLYEIGTGKLYPMLDRWKAFVESSQKKQLKLISRKYREPRPQFIRLLKNKNQELAEEDINNFIGSDLYDNCNVVVEAGSNIPKLQAAKQAMLSELGKGGILNLELPANRMEFQRQMGIAGFDNDVGPDVRRAEWENSLLDNIDLSPDNRPIVLDKDIHEIHIEKHAQRMKEPSFMSASEAVQQSYMQHIAEHEQMIQMAKQAMMAEAMATGQPPAPQQSGNAPSPMKKMGGGEPPKAVKEAMNADLVQGAAPSK